MEGITRRPARRCAHPRRCSVTDPVSTENESKSGEGGRGGEIGLENAARNGDRVPGANRTGWKILPRPAVV